MKIKAFSISIAVLLSLSALLVSCNQTAGGNSSEQETTAPVINTDPNIKVGELETAENGLHLRLYTEKNGAKYYAVVGIGKYKDASLVIPETFKSLSVQVIADGAFQGNKTVTSVTLPNSVKTIGKLAFGDCDKITEITLPDSVVTLGERAFSDCDTLATVNTGTGLNLIGKKCFYSCDKLETVSFGTSVKTIGFEAFFGCSSLKQLTLPNGLSVIEDHAFWGCVSLETIQIYDQLTHIGRDAFYACGKLTPTEEDGAFYLGNTENPHLLLMAISDKTVEEYTIHNDVKYIGQDVFSDCKALKAVTLPSGVSLLCEGSFRYCSVLEIIQFQNTTHAWQSVSKGYLWDHESGNYSVQCSDGTVAKAQ